MHTATWPLCTAGCLAQQPRLLAPLSWLNNNCDSRAFEPYCLGQRKRLERQLHGLPAPRLDSNTEAHITIDRSGPKNRRPEAKLKPAAYLGRPSSSRRSSGLLPERDYLASLEWQRGREILSAGCVIRTRKHPLIGLGTRSRKVLSTSIPNRRLRWSRWSTGSRRQLSRQGHREASRPRRHHLPIRNTRRSKGPEYTFGIALQA